MLRSQETDVWELQDRPTLPGQLSVATPHGSLPAPTSLSGVPLALAAEPSLSLAADVPRAQVSPLLQSQVLGSQGPSPGGAPRCPEEVPTGPGMPGRCLHLVVSLDWVMAALALSRCW